jgi:hypothetical protein
MAANQEAIQVLAKYLKPVIVKAKPPTIAEFAKTKFYIPETNFPLTLMPHQESILNYALDPVHGFQTIVYSTVKKSGKTAVASLVSRWVAETWGTRPEVYLFANDLEQARGRIYQKAIDSIELTPGYNTSRRELPGQWKIVERQGVYLPNHGILRAVSGDYKGEAGSNPTATFWCFDAETEILTKAGWVKYDALNVGDLVATRTALGYFKWQEVKAVNIQNYSGEMIRGKTKRFDCLVTPNHMLYGKAGSNRGVLAQERYAIKKYQVSDLVNIAHFWPVTTSRNWVGELAEIELPATERKPRRKLSLQPFVDFLAWYLSEGCVKYGKSGNPESVLIGQSLNKNLDKVTLIIRLIHELGYDYTTWDSEEVIAINDSQLARYCAQFGKSQDKFIPGWLKNLPRDYLVSFIAHYKLGDGYDDGAGFNIASISTRMIDDLLEIGQKAGYRVTYQYHTDARSKYKQGVIHFSNPGYYDPCVQRHQWSKVYYNGVVWCPSTDNGVVFVRRGGTCYWSGNSELWGYTSEASKRLWEELTPVPTRERSIRFVETYAGFEGESELLIDLYTRGVKEGRRLTHDDIYWPFPDQPPIYVNDAARQFTYWDDGPIARRMPWQTPEYYAAQEATLRPQAFQRLHLNYWTSSVSPFMPIEWWDNCKAPVHALDKHTPIVVGADAAVSSDCCALVGVSRHPDNPKHIAVRLSRVWSPPKGGTIDLETTIGDTIREWAKQYNIVEVAYDAYQLHNLMTNLTKEEVAWCRPFSQMGERSKADKQLYDLIRDRKLAHLGDDDIREHLKNSAAKLSKEEDSKMRIIKKSTDHKIDLVIAMSMATAECLRLTLD